MAGGTSDAKNGIQRLSSSQTPGVGATLNLKNELANSSSAYLRSHKDNLVAWQEWSPESIALAKTHEKPIFLSIGYSACHWCHVMSNESFESAEIANLLNKSFIPIKVDRESRPDLDDIYMNYVTATTGSGGWPLNVFLTPDLQPLFGGTYWPSPSSETVLPKSVDVADERPLNFLDIVQKIQDIWQNERQRCLASAADITHQLRAFAAEGVHAHSSVHVRGVDDENDAPEPLDLDLLDDALDHFVARYDSKYGGFTSAAAPSGPKFPTPANLTFLLRIGASITRPSTVTRFGFPSPVPGILGKKSCAIAANMALHTLQVMSRSALRDHLGNGFHRYSVTPDWNLPHFEKMLYDNALLLFVYCDAWALARNPEILGTICDLVEYLTSTESPIVRKDGGWYSSEDADSFPLLASTNTTHQGKKEGAFYVWTLKELQSILGDRDSSIVARHFGIKEDGNIIRQLDVNDEFINQNVLRIDATPSVLAKEFGLKEEEVVRIIKDGKSKMVDFRRSNRAAPEVDDKIVLSWNALTITALARASYTLASFDEKRAKISKDAALKGAAFIRSKMWNPQTGRVTRIHSDHVSSADNDRDLAFVDDYAYLIQSLRTLYDLTFDRSHLEWALQLQATLDKDFSAGPNGGYFQATVTPLTSQTGVVSSNSSLGDLAKQSTANNNSNAQSQAFPDQILNLKPGTDGELPSPNGIIAANLFYLSSYVASLSTSTIEGSTTTTGPLLQTSESLLTTANATIDAFAPEIIQHPFLYVSLLSTIVLQTVKITSLLIPPTNVLSDSALETQGIRGFGRTVMRSPSVKSGEIMICDNIAKSCRLLGERELEKLDEGFDDDEDKKPEVPPEIIQRRDEMARRESLAIERERMAKEHEGLGTSEDVRPVVEDVPPQ